jgi:succinate-semialdehyde dehydrogenase/glutarate-semialdehyde dehydrogenase
MSPICRRFSSAPTSFASAPISAGSGIEAESGRTFEVSNPARGDVIARVPDLRRAEIARAIDAAHAAQKPWAAKTGKERAKILRRWHDLMMEHQEDLAVLMTAEQGKPLTSPAGEVAYGAAYIEWFGEEAKRVYGETIPGPHARQAAFRDPPAGGRRGGHHALELSQRHDRAKGGAGARRGVQLRLAPRDADAALRARHGEARRGGGGAQGVFSVVTTTSSSEAGKEFCENPKVRKLTFTGARRSGASCSGRPPTR